MALTCRIVTFNCKSVKRSSDGIREFCKTADIVALQETWLLPDELSFLETLSDDFSSTGVSAVDTAAGMLRGRPYGGVALLWRRSAFQNVSIVQCHNSRICAIRIVLPEKSCIVMSVYMPTDAVANLAEFTDVLSSVNAVIDTYSESCVYILGDYNAHPTERFYIELSQFCIEQEWTCVDVEMLGLMSDTYTFISEAHGSKRWLDHCVATKAAIASVSNVYVLYDIMWSDHFPLVVECNLNVLQPKKPLNNTSLNVITWGERGQEQIHTYQRECHERLRLIDFPHELRECCDRTCSDPKHGVAIT
ncbi:jg25937, partial [Pararge aegeria aegeria]